MNLIHPRYDLVHLDLKPGNVFLGDRSNGEHSIVPVSKVIRAPARPM